jgi:hypothetical protein
MGERASSCGSNASKLHCRALHLSPSRRLHLGREHISPRQQLVRELVLSPSTTRILHISVTLGINIAQTSWRGSTSAMLIFRAFDLWRVYGRLADSTVSDRNRETHKFT